MRTLVKKMIIVCSFSLIPVTILVIQNFIIFRREWGSLPDLQYNLTFWLVRLLLTPFIIHYTLKYWTELSRTFRIIAIQVAGFIIYSILHWAISFLILFYIIRIIQINGARDLLDTIIDSSLVLNLLVYFATIAFYYLWEYVVRTIEADRHSLILQKDLAVAKLDNLKNQLNAHFLFNTLHTISSLIMLENKEDANKTLINLSELLRFALKENKEQFIPLYKEIELAKVYLEIQKIRFGEKLTYKIKSDHRHMQQMVPPLLLQPLLENAVRYAIEPMSGNGKIIIGTELVNDTLFLTVKDNGKPYNDTRYFNDGIGLSNLKQRLNQLYGDEHSFAIVSNHPSGGISIIIAIPGLSSKK
jgi:two-component system LytT family sensor kinase